MTRVFLAVGVLVTLLALAALGLGREQQSLARPGADAGSSEVIALLASSPLTGSRAQIEAEQRAFRERLRAEIPEARVRWRYRLVANGFAVALPEARVRDLRALPGVRDVYASASYSPALDRSAAHIGATGLWGANLDSAGQGMKIGIIDAGLDHRHEFFDPSGYSMPRGFPKGQRAFTNAKVIVARAFPPRGATSRAARSPFDGDESSHGTHVAGIAAGNPRTRAAGRPISGVAPRAYIGNYKALTRTSFGLSPNGNAPEIVAAIEAAVGDGMDVINLSIGQPEIEPRRDVVALALDAASKRGVVPVVSAGNDYAAAGAGSVWSPGSSASAITVGAVDIGASQDTHADFSSVGPSTVSLRLKPDVAAPGVAILSSLPGGWGRLSGTSMAAPHVAGAVALLRQRHPTWTASQVKSALVQTGTPISAGANGGLGPSFQGGGVVALNRADRPLVFAAPSSVSLGLVRPGTRVSRAVTLTDAGGGAGGAWSASIAGAAPRGVTVSVADTVQVPGRLTLQVAATAAAEHAEVSGYVVLRRGMDVRRIPYWGRVDAPTLARHRTRPLTRAGVYRATTRGRRALVSRYRYPENPRGLNVTIELAGPEVVYRLRLRRRVANFGVVVTRQRGSAVEPRVVSGLDENRLTGYAALPVNHNPYMATFRARIPVAGALSPAIGEYGLVFDSPTRAGAGTFTFRLWMNDVTPPTVRIRSRSVRRGRPLVVAVSDAGSGIYGDSLAVVVDGVEISTAVRGGRVRVPTGGLQPGRHRLRVRISDYQEAKNTENVARILPNTRFLATTFTVRP